LRIAAEADDEFLNVEDGGGHDHRSLASLRGAERRSNPFLLAAWRPWIASLRSQ
jgi:hypothetical protein